MEYVGLRVIRGKDWDSGGVDGGEGHVGTIVNDSGLQTVDVLWDNGNQNSCRIGQDGKYDLRIFDNGTVGVHHKGYSCLVCSEQDIKGMRWKCDVCPDCNLCPICYVTDKHDVRHEFIRFTTPNDPGTRVTKRAVAMKIQSMGIFPGAIVKRGKDWRWGNQDGGDGKTGEVLAVRNKDSTCRNRVIVKWTDNGEKKLYRVGADGQIDLRSVQEARGVFYYRDHLPDCSKTQAEDLKEGDEVRIKVSEEQLEVMQKEHSTFITQMKDCMGKVGKIKGTAPNGDFVVEFSGSLFNFYPGVLKKVEGIKVGDVVRILSDKSKVEGLQKRHGGYNPDMDQFCGKVGLIVKKRPNGDVIVQFGKSKYMYNSACCELAPGQTVYEAQGVDIDDTDMGRNLMKMLNMVNHLGEATAGSLLLQAIVSGDSDEAIAMIRKSPKLVNTSIKGLTPLILACNEGDRAVVDELLEKGADVNALERKGNSTLNAALSGKDRQIAKTLIKRGVNVNIIPDDKATAAHQAAHLGFADVLDMMIEKGCNINRQDKDGDTPIHIAIYVGHDDAVRSLCRAKNIDLTIINERGFTPIAFATLRGRSEAITTILDKSKETVNTAMVAVGHTPMHIAAINGHTHCAKILLQQGNADVNSRNIQNISPLHMACDHFYDETALFLIEHNADVNAQTNKGNTPLHSVLDVPKQIENTERDRRLKIAKALLSGGASATISNRAGQTPLELCRDLQTKEAMVKLVKERTGQNIQMTDGKCLKCKSSIADIKVTPCNHLSLCGPCALEVDTCPHCQQKIGERHRFKADVESQERVQCPAQ